MKGSDSSDFQMGRRTRGPASVYAALLALTTLTACERKPDLYSCSTTIEKEFPSPDGRHMAVVFHRECGATTDFNTQVGLRGRGEDLNPDGGKVVVIGGEHPLTPSWRSPTELVIQLPDNRVFMQLARWKTIAIEYVEPAVSR